MAAKRFHCQGGAVFSLLHPPSMHLTIPLIVSFQTISDYLDNLCDRLLTGPEFSTTKKPVPDPGISDAEKEQAFRLLHSAMFHALEPGSTHHTDYYRLFPNKEDGNYLDSLVRHCQSRIILLPSFSRVREQILPLVQLYCDLQSLKHLSVENRTSYLQSWFYCYEEPLPRIRWNEFAAASGSTLGVFTLLVLASKKDVSNQEIEEVTRGYFPWICGLHILLDYLVDQQEDRTGGELNFVSSYPGQELGAERLKLFASMALEQAGQLQNPLFHRSVVKGLLALYLSDPKIKTQGLTQISSALLAETKEKDIIFLHALCRILRQAKII